ncbi:FMN-binding protein [Lachnoclostridium sp.]|nr:FMN-binding protein [Lachnoclostridium sp.]
MRNNKRWIAVTALAGITAAALITAVVVRNNLNKEAEGAIAIVQQGTDMGIKQVQVLKDKAGTVTGYTVNVESKGFGETPMELAISFNAEKDTITGIEVVSHTETDGFGAKMTQPEFLDQFKGAKLPIYIPGVSLTSASSKVKEVTTMTTTSSALKDGKYEVKANEASNGYTSQVSMTVAGGLITEVVWDCVDANGNLKSVQAINGEYVMTEKGPNWAEQAESLAQYVIEHQGLTGLTIDESGKTDVVASVSISISDFVAQVEECLTLASSAQVLNDGTYEKVATEAHNGYTSSVKLTVSGGKITDVIWDCADADGKLKSVLSQNGEYVMTEKGATWNEQAQALAQYVIEKQGTTGLTLDESGKTDVVASVSIDITEFVDQVEDCLRQASAQPVALNDGTYDIVAAEAYNGYTSKLSLTVAGGKITDVVWDCEDANGNLKSIQSQNGEYVMTEKGATWNEQAQALAQYVIANQGTAGLTLDESGKTDVVATVSISINEFVDQVEEALRQAAGVKEEVKLNDGIFEIVAPEANNGYVSKLTLTVAGGKVTDVVWDCEDANGKLKSILSQNGEYVMTEKGATWYEQAQLLAKYVIEHQGTAGLTLDENGKTDVIATVSIDISEFVNQVEQALRQSAGEAEPEPEQPEKEEEKEPEVVDGTKVDGISGATITTKAILSAINNAYDYIVNYVNE